MNEIAAGPEPLLTLAPLSVLAGIAMVLLFNRLADPRAIRRSTNRMIALAMEFRLFIDEPALILRTQRELFTENARLLKLIALPTLIVSVASVLLFPHLDGLYGYAPLSVNEPAVITARFRTMPLATPSLRADTKALVIETPGVRALAAGEVSWRIRPMTGMAGYIEVITPEGPESKRVVAGRGWRYVAPLRGSSWLTSLEHPFERPLAGGGLHAIAIAYPRREILGFGWIAWFLGITSLTTLVVVPGARLIRRRRPRR